MATAVTAAFPSDKRGFSTWFWDFLRSELKPYPGRGMVVARTVIAATITMILVMTFRIPGGFLGTFFVFLISREDLASTTKSALTIVAAFGLGGLFSPIGATMFASSLPLTHFVWEGVSLFLIFFLIGTIREYPAAALTGVSGASIIGLWYLPGPAEANLERTLWQVASPALGAGVTFCVEAIFRAFSQKDELLVALDAHLGAVETLLRSRATGAPVPQETRNRLTQYAMVGTGRLRRVIARSNVEQGYRAQMTAVIALTGRAVDFAAAILDAHAELTPIDQQIAANVALQLTEIRNALASSRRPKNLEAGKLVSSLPLLREMEAMIALIPRVFEGALSLEMFQVPVNEPRAGILVHDAFTNPEHLRFAAGGCLAGMLCYILYVSLDWPGLSTSLITCAVTALSTIGASRQKQVLNIAGAVLGGFVLGLGAQILILPHFDSIGGFTLTFAAASAIAAWIGTSSSRLSYCGLQTAFAFYLVHLSDFSLQTSLTPARDRVLGVLLGVTMMWLVFDRFRPKKAVSVMVDTFIANLRLLGGLATTEMQGHDQEAIAAVHRLRDTISANFAAVTSQADAVPFEVGSGRMRHMAARERIRRWQAMLRTFYLLQLAVPQVRVYGSQEILSAPEQNEQNALFRIDQSCSGVLMQMAKYLEVQHDEEPRQPAFSIDHPLFLPEAAEAKAGSLLSIGREMAKILDRIRGEMLAVPLFNVE
jgi:multidrug resistance protein MdtO